jgi:hypothetical protein
VKIKFKARKKKKERSNQKLNLKIQQEGNEVGIEAINNIYNEKFKKIVHFCWIQRFLMPNSTPLWLQKVKH